MTAVMEGAARAAAQVLANGPIPSDELDRAIEAAGYSPRALRRARDKGLIQYEKRAGVAKLSEDVPSPDLETQETSKPSRPLRLESTEKATKIAPEGDDVPSLDVGALKEEVKLELHMEGLRPEHREQVQDALDELGLKAATRVAKALVSAATRPEPVVAPAPPRRPPTRPGIAAMPEGRRSFSTAEVMRMPAGERREIIARAKAGRVRLT